MPGRDAPRDSGAADKHQDDGETSAHDLSEYGVGVARDEPSTTVGPLPVRVRPASSQVNLPARANVPREASRRAFKAAVDADERAPEPTRAEMNPLLKPKSSAKAPPPVGHGTEETLLPDEVFGPDAEDLGFKTTPPVAVSEPRTSVTMPPITVPPKAQPASSPKVDQGPLRPRSDPGSPPPRSSTRGEMPAYGAPKVGGLVLGAVQRKADSGRPGPESTAAPRKGTRPEMAIVASSASVAPVGAGPPGNGSPPRRSGTRGEVPIAKAPPAERLPPPVDQPVRPLEPRPGSALADLLPEARPEKKAPGRIEDEVTGPTNEPAKLGASRAGDVGESTAPIDVATGKPVQPAPPATAALPKPVPSPEPSRGGNQRQPSPNARPMLSQQHTGQLPALDPDSENAGAKSKKKGAARRVLESLKKLAAGFHELGQSPGVRDLIQKTGMLKLSQIKSVTGLHRLGERRFGFQAVIAAVMLLCGVGLMIHLVSGADVPPEETLQFLYPFGFTGRMQPNGRMAPPVNQVSFKFTGTVDCGSNICDHYVVTGRDGVFRIEMTVAKHDDGTWALVGGGAPPR